MDSRDSMLRSCEGVRSWSKRTSDAFVLATALTISSSLPWADETGGIGPLAALDEGGGNGRTG